MDKTAIRQWIRDKKRAMTIVDIETRSRTLTTLCLNTEAYHRASSIYGYLPFNQEVRTAWLLEQALVDGKRVALPKVFGDTMRFIEMSSLDAVQRGYAGISEPIFDTPIAHDDNALVLVPGLAFDRLGHRIGYGRGFYDRFFAMEPNHPTIALCYDFQMFENLPVEDHDQTVNRVIWV